MTLEKLKELSRDYLEKLEAYNLASSKATDAQFAMDDAYQAYCQASTEHEYALAAQKGEAK